MNEALKKNTTYIFAALCNLGQLALVRLFVSYDLLQLPAYI